MTDADLAGYFQIGICGKPHGVKGEVRVFPTTDDPDRFGLLAEVTLQRPAATAVYPLERARRQQNVVVLKLKGIDDRAAAERLHQARVMIPPGLALKLEDDQYYVRDLIGLDVYADTGERLGVLSQVLETGANDVYAVKPPEGKEILLPAIKSCVLSVSLAENKMTVRTP